MEALDPTLITLLLLCAAAMVAGFLDVLVGGGGLITIPALLISGVPPISVLGTNKLQATMGSATASFMMLKRKKVVFADVRQLMLAVFLGSIIGSIIIQFFDANSLNIIIPVVIVIIAVYFLLAPKQSMLQREALITERRYRYAVLPSIGFYDGMFGPATGSFLVLAGVSLRGQELIHATATAKTLNFATNIAALLVFITFGKVVWLLGVVMMLGQFIGANLGARYLLIINPNILRYLLVVVCFVILTLWILF